MSSIDTGLEEVRNAKAYVKIAAPALLSTFCGGTSTGGSICIFSEGGRILSAEELQKPENPKSLRELAIENVIRLRADSDATFSSELATSTLDKVIGAVRMENGIIISITGFSTKVNEALALSTGCYMEWTFLRNRKNVSEMTIGYPAYCVIDRVARLANGFPMHNVHTPKCMRAVEINV